MLILKSILSELGNVESISTALGVSLEDVESWLKGVKYPNALLIQKIAKLVNMSDSDVWRAIFNDATR